MKALIIARVIAGLGGSMMYSGTMTYVALLTNKKERPIHMSGNAVVWEIGSVLGPVVWRMTCSKKNTQLMEI